MKQAILVIFGAPGKGRYVYQGCLQFYDVFAKTDLLLVTFDGAGAGHKLMYS